MIASAQRGRPQPELRPLVNLTTCADEPIHTPGHIQPFGVLLAVDTNGQVCRVSANLADYLSITPEQALLSPLTDILGADLAENCAKSWSASDHPELIDTPIPASPGMFTLRLSHSDRRRIVELTPCCHGTDAYAHVLHQHARNCEALMQFDSPQTLLEAAAELVARETGFHRTMVYRFDTSMNGRVIAEFTQGVEPRWLGHHFPHTDIPTQARALYLRNRTRLITDINAAPVPLLGLAGALDEPLDLSTASLRAVSPIHIEYMQNMGVAATLTMSLIVRNRLWGLLVCHHQTPRTVPAPVQLFCDLTAQFVSLRVLQLLDQELQLESERILTEIDRIMQQMLAAPTLAQGAVASRLLCDAFAADAFTMHLMGETVTLGCDVPDDAREAITAWARNRAGFDLMSSHELGTTLEDAPFPDCALSGALYVPLSSDGSDYLLWLRAEYLRRVAWAGNPNENKVGPGLSQPLSPRRSFDTWVELVRGQSLPWTPSELRGARALGQKIRNELTNELKLSREREALMRQYALHDALTGLPSRRLLLDRMHHAVERAERHQLGFVVLFLDLDGFKAVNDDFGHQVGDQLLQQVAKRLVASVRQIDTLARLGGDEFVILLDEISLADPAQSRQQATAIAEKLRDTLAEPFALGTAAYQISVSIGIAAFPEAGRTPQGLLEAADKAMYQAKKAGKNRCAWAPALTTDATDHDR